MAVRREVLDGPIRQPLKPATARFGTKPCCSMITSNNKAFTTVNANTFTSLGFIDSLEQVFSHGKQDGLPSIGFSDIAVTRRFQLPLCRQKQLAKEFGFCRRELDPHGARLATGLANIIDFVSSLKLSAFQPTNFLTQAHTQEQIAAERDGCHPDRQLPSAPCRSTEKRSANSTLAIESRDYFYVVDKGKRSDSVFWHFIDCLQTAAPDHERSDSWPPPSGSSGAHVPPGEHSFVDGAARTATRWRHRPICSAVLRPWRSGSRSGGRTGGAERFSDSITVARAPPVPSAVGCDAPGGPVPATLLAFGCWHTTSGV